MLINTLDGWRPLGAPTSSVAEAATGRRLELKMADELAQLCPTLGAFGAQNAAKALYTDLAKTFGGR